MTLITLVILGSIYLLPTLVAMFREHRNALAIFVMNLCLGWTFIGWVGALVWACTNNVYADEGNHIR
jgi:ABC-type transport system involved in cytochrome c biogenesis permease component